MDYKLLAIKLSIYGIVFILINTLLHKSFKVPKVGTDDDGNIYINEKDTSKFFWILSNIMTVVVLAISCLPDGDDAIGKIILCMFLGALCLLGFIVSLVYGLWCVKLEDNLIIGKTYLGRKYEIPYSDITCFERLTNGNLVLYKGSEKLISYGSDYASLIVQILEHKSINPKPKDSKHTIIKPTKYQLLLGYILIFMFIAFSIMFIFLKELGYAILGGIFVILCIYISLSQHKMKYIIENDYIESYSMFQKKKVIYFDEIDRVEIEQQGKASFFTIYLKNSKKPELKINIHLENIYVLEELALKKKWIK